MNNLEYKNDEIMQEDAEILASKIHNIGDLKSKTILVTGATGLLGAQLVKAFLCCNRIYDENIKILALVRNEKNLNSAFGDLIDRENLNLIYGDVNKPLSIECDIDYIMHSAGVTGNSKIHIEHPTSTIKTALFGTYNILELAKEKNISGMVYFSTWEIYGITNPEKDCIKENDYGYMEIIDTRRSYSESKRMCETMCTSYASEFDVPVSVGRLPLTFGPGVRPNDNRVFAQFARSVINKTDIVLKTEGKTLRNHCYTRDALYGLIMVMCKGARGESYNIVNHDTAMSIIDMATLCCNLFENSKIQVKLELDDYKKYGYNPEVKCLLNSDKLQALGWKPEVGIEDMFKRMIISMQYSAEKTSEV